MVALLHPANVLFVLLFGCIRRQRILIVDAFIIIPPAVSSTRSIDRCDRVVIGSGSSSLSLSSSCRFVCSRRPCRFEKRILQRRRRRRQPWWMSCCSDDDGGDNKNVRRRNPTLHATLRPEQQSTQTTTTAGRKGGATTSSSSSSVSLFFEDVFSVLQLTLYALLVSVLVISWEDCLCRYALPSRNTQSLLLSAASSPATSQPQQPSSSPASIIDHWGEITTHGMGFGLPQRQQLQTILLPTTDSDDDADAVSAFLLTSRPSYNEVMLHHREERVPRWRQQQQQQQQQPFSYTLNDDDMMISDENNNNLVDAFHTVCQCLQTTWELQKLASNYQWDEIRQRIHSSPLTGLEPAASLLRVAISSSTATSASTHDPTIGFDWGSCGWKSHCGALADTQEALDEIEHLLVVLEPHEVLFCLDIVERSLREIIAVSAPLLVTVAANIDAYADGRGGTTNHHRSQEPQQANVVELRRMLKRDLQLYYHDMPAYETPQRMVQQQRNGPETTGGDPVVSDSQIDDEYLRALQDLRL